MKKQYGINKNKYLLEPEQISLQHTLGKFQAEDFRNTTLIWLLINTGARATEALNLRPRDLNQHDQSVLITGIKGSNDREVLVAEWLFDRLLTLAEGNPERLFDISYKRLGQIWELYRPCEKTAHSLRHTFAINTYRHCRDVRFVQRMLGHRNISNTLVYVDYVDSLEQSRQKLNLPERR